MLLKVADDVKNGKLTCYLQDAYESQLLETLRVLEDELQAWEEAASGDGVACDQDECPKSGGDE